MLAILPAGCREPAAEPTFLPGGPPFHVRVRLLDGLPAVRRVPARTGRRPPRLDGATACPPSPYAIGSKRAWKKRRNFGS